MQFSIVTNINGSFCLFIGSTLGYYPQRVAPYHTGANDPFPVEASQHSFQEPSQRLFWGNQGTNQVGGTGLWAHLTNKFPFLGNMFGRLEVPSQYGVPNQNNVLPTEYGVPGINQAQYYAQQQQQQFYQTPQFYQQPQQYFRQVPQQPGQQNFALGRDVGITDDAIIVTPPFVPPVAQPAPAPAPIPVPVPAPPAPASEPAQGYTYNKPQYRLELPHK